MTLIQTLLSPTRILQVSDRRLTKGGKPVNDSTNKVVSWCAKFTVAFTGPAFMDLKQKNLPTSEWIASTMAENGDGGGDVATVVEMLQASLNAKLAELPSTWDKRMTVTMSGFAKFSDLATNVPVCYSISNYERFEDGEVKIYPEHFPDFEVHVARYVGGSSQEVEFVYRTNGHQMDIEEMRLIRRLLPRLFKDQNWDGIVRSMIHVQRRISERVDPKKAEYVSRVGLDAQVMSLPKLADEDPMGHTLLTDVSTTNLADDRPTFVYVPAAGFDGQVFGPHFVCQGQAMSFEGYEPPSSGDVGEGRTIYKILKSAQP
jgi:hypothetical protein